MAFMVNPDHIRSVLVGGEWISVEPGTFQVDCLYVAADYSIAQDGGFAFSDIPSDVNCMGFMFRSPDGESVCGPMRSIQAMKFGSRP